MDIIKTAIQWAKDEVFSSLFFILFGVMFVVATIGFWQLGKSEMARSFIIPTLVAGLLLFTIGVGLFVTNNARANTFESQYNDNKDSFIETEIARTEKIVGEYKTIVFTVIPGFIIFAALLLVFINTPLWRAIGITTIAMMVCIMLVDSNANDRVIAYHKALLSVKKI